jgi:hypothetical protein
MKTGRAQNGLVQHQGRTRNLAEIAPTDLSQCPVFHTRRPEGHYLKRLCLARVIPYVACTKQEAGWRGKASIPHAIQFRLEN